MRRRIIIVGGGIVGLATAYKLQKNAPDLQIIVLEKEGVIAAHQTGHNSGVIHSGLYYKPGSHKALLSMRGRRELVEFAAQNGVPHQICGKLIVAADASEVPELKELYDRGRANGLSDLRYLTAAEAVEYEPHIRPAAAILVRETGIIDFAEVARALARATELAGARILVGSTVTRIARTQSQGWRVRTTTGEFEAEYLIACAGLHADRIAHLAGEKTNVRIVPFRGDYFTVRADARQLVRNLIYPVPNPLFPFLGVHATRTIHGTVHVGPSAVLALAREGYHRGAIHVHDAVSALSFPGVWRFAARHPQLVLEGLHLANRKSAFVRAVQRLIPEFSAHDLEHRESGVRAQAMLPSGQLVDDFLFVETQRAIHVLNAPSPAATGGLAIGEVIASKALAAMGS